METNNPLEQRINPRTTIWLPLWVAVALVVLTIFSFIVAYFTGGEISKWASAFTTLVIITIIISSLVVFATLAFAIGGMKELSKHMPEWLIKIQVYSVIGNAGSKRLMNGLTRPVIFVRQGIAGLRSTFNRK